MSRHPTPLQHLATNTATRLQQHASPILGRDGYLKPIDTRILMFANKDLNGSRALEVFNAIIEALTQRAKQMESWLLDKKTIAISKKLEQQVFSSFESPICCPWLLLELCAPPKQETPSSAIQIAFRGSRLLQHGRRLTNQTSAE